MICFSSNKQTHDKQTHETYLQFYAYCFQINQVLHQVPQTPIQEDFSPISISSFVSSCLTPLHCLLIRKLSASIIAERL